MKRYPEIFFVRGGSWYGFADYCRSALRFIDYPADRSLHFGFRLVFVP